MILGGWGGGKKTPAWTSWAGGEDNQGGWQDIPGYLYPEGGGAVQGVGGTR